MANIGDLVATLRMQSEPFSRGIRQAKAETRSFGSVVHSVLAVAVPAASIAGLGFMVSRTLEATDTLAKLSRRLRLSTDDIIAWRRAADQGGSSARQLDAGLEFLQRGLGGVDDNSGAAAAALRRLGLSLTQIRQLPTGEAIRDISDALAAVDNSFERARIGADLFGRGNAELAEILGQGREQLDEYVRRAGQLSLLLGDIDTRRIEQLNDLWDDAGRILRARVTMALLHVAELLQRSTELTVVWWREIVRIGGSIASFIGTLLVWNKAAIIAAAAVRAWTAATAALATAKALLLAMIDPSFLLRFAVAVAVATATYAAMGRMVATATEAAQESTQAMADLEQRIGGIDTTGRRAIATIRQQADALETLAEKQRRFRETLLEPALARQDPAREFSRAIEDLVRLGAAGGSTLRELGQVQEDLFQQWLGALPGVGRLTTAMDEHRQAVRALHGAYLSQAISAEQFRRGIEAANQALRDRDPVIQQIHALEEHVLLLERGADALAHFRLEQDGATEPQLRHAAALRATIRELERAEAAQRDLEQAARQVMERSRSPLEQFMTDLDRLREMFEGRLIDDIAFRHEIDRLKEVLEQGLELHVQRPELRAVERGSREAFAAIARAQQDRRGPEHEILDQARQQVRELERATAWLERLHELARRRGEPIVVDRL